jgi:hypothetical protein
MQFYKEFNYNYIIYEEFVLETICYESVGRTCVLVKQLCDLFFNVRLRTTTSRRSSPLTVHLFGGVRRA